MSDLVGNPEDRFSHNEAHFITLCFITECANLSAPMFGSVSQSGKIVGAIADYSCETGYQLSGSQSRSCSITGSWTGIVPICEPIGESSMCLCLYT